MSINIFKKHDREFIAYKQYKIDDGLTVVFVHGLRSDMSSKKAQFIHDLCIELNINFIKFDNFGHGQSSGDFIDQTIDSWLDGLKLILDQVISGDFILIGSSMGGWLSILAALEYNTRLRGLLLLAPAPDFTEELIWQQLPQAMQDLVVQQGFLEIDDHGNLYKISYAAITQARKHLIFVGNKILFINCKIHIIHGKLDNAVPYSTALRLADVLNAPAITIELLQASQHRLSTMNDLQTIGTALKNLLN